MNLIFRLLLTLNATSWMVVVYALKAEWTYKSIPVWGIALLILCIPILLSALSIRITSKSLFKISPRMSWRRIFRPDCVIDSATAPSRGRAELNCA